MAISNTGWVILLITGFIGLFIGYKFGPKLKFKIRLSKKFPFIIKKKIEEIDTLTKEERKILNDPKLLLEKLNANGQIYDLGEKIDLKIEDVNGKKQVVVHREKVKVPIIKKTKDNKKGKKKVVRKKVGRKKK